MVGTFGEGKEEPGQVEDGGPREAMGRTCGSRLLTEGEFGRAISLERLLESVGGVTLLVLESTKVWPDVTRIAMKTGSWAG